MSLVHTWGVHAGVTWNVLSIMAFQANQGKLFRSGPTSVILSPGENIRVDALAIPLAITPLAANAGPPMRGRGAPASHPASNTE